MKVNRLWWIAGILAGILLLGAISYVVSYQILEDRRTEGMEETKAFLEQQEKGVEVTESYSFTGDLPVHILYASKGNQEKVYYINKKDKAILETMDRQEQVSREEVKQAWKNNCGSCIFSNIRPAYKNERPLWEITFKDGEGRYGLSYFHAETGEQYQKFAFKNDE
ncbi:hypothetical protein U0355_07090 [Salimicrobium sp. PL1-032A]|uniref:hypothetical protein n=1 Tax=Salimicrobium sp. PL1-032A TaxID=3095364 RepID=UPI0032607BF2